MWIRLRFDLGWRDLLWAVFFCLRPGSRSWPLAAARRAWSVEPDILITLSVRSAFDLYLRALSLPEKSEVLFSALTVPDMVHIVRSHGLIPVPVDIDIHGHLCLDSLRSACSENSRILVVAHLFGGRMPLDEVAGIAAGKNLKIVEDCAQSFNAVGERGHADSDLVLHSFGPIKTATALGGAVCRIASPQLRQQMKTILAADSVQSNWVYGRKAVRFGMLKLASGNLLFGCLNWIFDLLRIDPDQWIGSLARNFSDGHIDRLRRRPSAALLRMLHRRWTGYDFDRIKRRQRIGRFLDRIHHQSHDIQHTYWLYPLFTDHRSHVRSRLRKAGFDATWCSRMMVVQGVTEKNDPAEAIENWSRLLFVPCYPELPLATLAELMDVVNE